MNKHISELDVCDSWKMFGKKDLGRHEENILDNLLSCHGHELIHFGEDYEVWKNMIAHKSQHGI